VKRSRGEFLLIVSTYGPGSREVFFSRIREICRQQRIGTKELSTRPTIREYGYSESWGSCLNSWEMLTKPSFITPKRYRSIPHTYSAISVWRRFSPGAGIQLMLWQFGIYTLKRGDLKAPHYAKQRVSTIVLTERIWLIALER